ISRVGSPTCLCQARPPSVCFAAYYCMLLQRLLLLLRLRFQLAPFRAASASRRPLGRAAFGTRSESLDRAGRRCRRAGQGRARAFSLRFTQDDEEHTPLGETSFGGFAGKRYRFTGRERDQVSGLAYPGARHCAPWLGRRLSPDPRGPVDGLNLYAFVAGNPNAYVDPSGTEGTPVGDDVRATDPRPFDRRLQAARICAAANTRELKPTPEEVWECGVAEGHFSGSEHEQVLKAVDSAYNERVERTMRRARLEADMRREAEWNAFFNQIQLAPIQAALVGGGSFRGQRRARLLRPAGGADREGAVRGLRLGERRRLCEGGVP